MFAKSLQSIHQVSSPYVLFNNIWNKFVRSGIKPTSILIGDQYQATQRSSNSDLLKALNFLWKNLNILRSAASQLRFGSNKMLNYLPFFVSGNIVSGFGRGSKELGIPTANFPLEVVKSLPESFQPGVYYGWANIDNGPVHKMVMSIGWNPFYDNKEKSMETHILHEFGRDLYGCLLKLCIVGYLRPERNFNSLEELVDCIKDDIRQAENLLDSIETSKHLQSHQYFKDSDKTNNK